MNLRRSTRCFVMGGLLLLAGRLQADTPQQIRKTIEASYARSAEAANNRDTDGYVAMLTDDFVAVNTSGKTMNRSQMRANMENSLSAAATIHESYKVSKVSVSGKTATAEVTERTEMTVEDPNTLKTLKLAQTTTSRDTWRVTPKGWRLSKSKYLSEHPSVIEK